MPGPQPASNVKLESKQRKVLKQMLRRHKLAQCLVWRIRIILLADKGHNNSKISRRVGKDRKIVRQWRKRWVEARATFEAAQEKVVSKRQWAAIFEDVLSDAPRPGAPGKFTPEQLVVIIAVACEPPEKSRRPITHWTPEELADEVIQRGVVTSISPRTVKRLLAGADLKPHLSRYWLNANPEDPEAFDAQVRLVCELYAQAKILYKAGIHLVSTDEKTGIQALERKYPTKEMKTGLVERREFEYIRHGVRCLMANFEVATGQIITPTVGPTRTEADFAAHIANTVATDPTGEWIFIADQLNTHQSETLVCWVAEQCGIEMGLGKKGKSGVLKSTETRKAFLQDATHRIRFVYTPKHTSWLNQVEIWFSILVRKLLKRASFTSLEELEKRILDFIDYFNRILAKPFKWTYSGKPLVA